MVRGGSSTKRAADTDETRERTRLKDLAVRRNLLSQAPPKCSLPLVPSNQVAKHHGADIIRKSHRKNRFLFSLPGLFAPLSAGTIGHLEHLRSKNPVLYLHFPQGRMKLFGTIIYPKNRYLSLQFSRGGKNVICEDSFDHMIVFSEAWWVGRKEDNPTEDRLEFPSELTEGGPTEIDFKGGAGAGVPNGKYTVNQHVKKETVKIDSEDELSDDMADYENMETKMKVTPVRHSERNARKIFNFAENSDSGDEVSSGASEGKDEVKMNSDSFTGTKRGGEPTHHQNSGGSLVQTSLSALFKKAEEKKASRSTTRSSSSKASNKKRLHAGSKKEVEESDGSDEDWTAGAT